MLSTAMAEMEAADLKERGGVALTHTQTPAHTNAKSSVKTGDQANDGEDGNDVVDNDTDNANDVDDNVATACMNWSQPSLVFPFLIRALDCPLYSQAIIKGLVTACGGLTEAIVKASTTALLAYCGKQKSEARTDGLSQLAQTLVDMLCDNPPDRVIVPLLKTIELLLRNGCFDVLMRQSSKQQQHQHSKEKENTKNDKEIANDSISLSTFPSLLLSSLQPILQESTDVHKLKISIDILVLLLAGPDPVRHRALKSLCVLLGHRFPRIRTHAAEALYLQCLSDPHAVGPRTERDGESDHESDNDNDNDNRGGGLNDNDNKEKKGAGVKSGIAPTPHALDSAVTLLTTSRWDGPTSEARTLRQTLCDTLQLQMKKKEANKEAAGEAGEGKGGGKGLKKGGGAGKADELDSYEYLVREAGY